MTKIALLRPESQSYSQKADNVVLIMRQQIQALWETHCLQPDVTGRCYVELCDLRDEFNALLGDMVERNTMAWLAGMMGRV